MKQRTKDIVEGIDTLAGQAFDLAVQGLIVLSFLTFASETVLGLDPAVAQG